MRQQCLARIELKSRPDFPHPSIHRKVATVKTLVTARFPEDKQTIRRYNGGKGPSKKGLKSEPGQVENQICPLPSRSSSSTSHIGREVGPQIGDEKKVWRARRGEITTHPGLPYTPRAARDKILLPSSPSLTLSAQKRGCFSCSCTYMGTAPFKLESASWFLFNILACLLACSAYSYSKGGPRYGERRASVCSNGGGGDKG